MEFEVQPELGVGSHRVFGTGAGGRGGRRRQEQNVTVPDSGRCDRHSGVSKVEKRPGALAVSMMFGHGES